MTMLARVRQAATDARRRPRLWMAAGAALWVVAYLALRPGEVVIKPLAGPSPGRLFLSAQQSVAFHGTTGSTPARGLLLEVNPRDGSHRVLARQLALRSRLSPDGRTLAYLTDAHEVWLLSLDGSAPRRVPGLAGSPVWSPDGRSIACTNDLLFAKPSTVAPGTFRVDLDEFDAGKTSLNPLPVPSPEWLADWSPDGRWLLVETGNLSKPSPFMQIGLRSVDGKEFRQLTEGALNYRARFVPGGRSVLFSRFEGGSARVCRINIDGTDFRTILDGFAGNPSADLSACLSPDGKTLAILNSGTVLEFADPDGKNRRRLEMRVRVPMMISQPGSWFRPGPLSIGGVEWARLASGAD